MRATLPQSRTDNITAERLSWLPWLLLLGLNGLRSGRSRQQDTPQHPIAAPRGARRAHIASLAGSRCPHRAARPGRCPGSTLAARAAVPCPGGVAV